MVGTYKATPVSLLGSFCQVIGSIDGSGRVRLVDKTAPAGTPTPVDLDLEQVLGSMPDKTFEFTRWVVLLLLVGGLAAASGRSCYCWWVFLLLLVQRGIACRHIHFE